MRKNSKVSQSTGIGKARPVIGDGKLLDIGNLPDGSILTQKGNSCGTCSLSAVLRHFGIVRSQSEIDREIRNFNIFTAPDLIVRYANSVGLEASYKNDGTLEELENLIEQGIPAILLTDPKPESPINFLYLHYVTAISIRKTDNQTYIGIYNPWGLREEITKNELENGWAKVRIGPFLCWNRAFIAIAPKGSNLGENRYSGSRGINMIGLSIACLVNGIAKIFRGELNNGARDLAEGLYSLPLGILISFKEMILAGKQKSRNT